MKFTILLTILAVTLVAGTTAQRRKCPQGRRRPRCSGRLNMGSRCPLNFPRTMWYYNRDTRTCISMPHLGCGGNANRWCNLADCQRRCIRSTG